MCRKYVPSEPDSSDYDSEEEYGASEGKKPSKRPV